MKCFTNGVPSSKFQVSNRAIRKIVHAVMFLALGTWNLEPLWACPFCKDVVNAANASLARGFYWSILFMLAVVFGVFGIIWLVIVKAQRQRRAHPSGQQ